MKRHASALKLFKEYTFNSYNVRKAELVDGETVFRILQDTASWLRSKGVAQWEEFLHDDGMITTVNQAILSGITYIVGENAGDIVAVFNLSSEQNDWDIDMWGKRNDSAYYLHKLAVAKDYRRQQIGGQILGWIDDNIRDGCVVRLDCYADNPILNQYYHQAGFTFVGYANRGEDRFSLYER
jgi:GNAT superfamily N-acetyltransferase